MNIEEIRELIDLVTETGVAELEVQRGENRVRIRRGVQVESLEVTAPASRAGAAVPPPPTGKPAEKVPEPVPPAPNSETLVKSPIVGTFYESASPGSPPFVRIGEAVQPGKVLCIIESMKLMNEIEAEVSGVIASKLVANGQPVEYGEALFGIRPV
ncbi:MAG: acetyl-CoA carboxylase biotin carboxyl carrier protein [Acidobacteria bacterium]|nr:acetyl-CoA carboxylase biotin carboxyl carrier protein [Acidobacteriota bacterium]MBI3472572.1 acetyl-CoA carboxylase biotin carboxyl carrier protein [Candidatus Solibacter usitatus]